MKVGLDDIDKAFEALLKDEEVKVVFYLFFALRSYNENVSTTIHSFQSFEKESSALTMMSYFFFQIDICELEAFYCKRKLYI